MFKYFSSMGADSGFEKNRLILTGRNMEAPEQYIIKKILKTFQGEDDETRSQIAFATIVKKIQTSDSNDNWIYLLKNLIILDRVVNEQCFVEQVLELSLPVIENYHERNNKYAALRTDLIIKNYWKLIKFTSRLLANRKNICYFPRSQRTQFLATLTPKETMNQMQTLHDLFQTIFALISSIASTKNMAPSALKGVQEFKKSNLISYILLQLLYKLISLYTSEMLCMNMIVSIMAKDINMEYLSLDDVRRFRSLISKFKMNSSRIIEFIQENKTIKGFEVISYRDLDPMPDNNVIKSVDKYLSERANKEDQHHKVHALIVDDSSMPIKVRFKPRVSGDQNYHPRKKLQAARVQNMNNAFQNYISNFSEDFPSKEVMTIDLIMAIKKEKDNQHQKERWTNYEEPIIYNDRETCAINHHQEIPSHLHFRKIEEESEDLSKFVNIYSPLPTAWNAS